eukprot:SAG11_NODE_22399_length_406_cov_5.302932_1_plen_59_part_01
MVLVATLVTTDDGSVSGSIRPSRPSSPRMPERLWGTRMASGGHICVDRCAFFIGFSIGN